MHAAYRRLMVLARAKRPNSFNWAPISGSDTSVTSVRMGNWASQMFGGGATEPPSTGAAAQEKGVVNENEDPKKISEAEWKQRLSADEYYICRQKGTERPFTGYYNTHKEEGKYNCVCCGAELFGSDAKFESGCGWPSFYQASGASGPDDTHSNVIEQHDSSHGMSRTEVLCKQCHSHLGHVFDDGPRPTGLRYCINSVSLKFKPKEQS